MDNSKRIKVLHIVKWFPNELDPQNGIFIQRHIEAVADTVENHILFLYESPVQEELVKVLKGQTYFGWVHKVKFRTGIVSVQKWLTKVALYHHFIEELIQPDLIHFHIGTPDQALASFFARKKRIPFVISEHWGGFLDKRFSQYNFWQKRLVKRLFKKATTVMPVSKVLEKGMMTNGLKFTSKLVPNIVNVPQKASKKFPDFTFVVIADMDDHMKRISEIVVAFSVFRMSFPEARMEIIGGGPDFEKVNSKVAELQLQPHVKLHGRKPQEEAMEILAASHCLVINSLRETFSVVGIEALSLGIPVISSKCGGPEGYLHPAFSILYNEQKELPLAMRAMRENYEAYLDGIELFDALPYQSDVVGEKLANIYFSAIHAMK